MRSLSFGAPIVAALLFCAAPALAQQSPAPTKAEESAATQQVQRQQSQPLNNAPVWREVRSGEPGYTTAMTPEAGVLIQSRGQTWREARVPIAFWGGLLVAVAIAGLAVFFLLRGPLSVDEPPTGRSILRFTLADRAAHWLLAIAWVILALTGLVLSFGKDLLLPVIGYTLFSWLATFSKNLHNFVGPILIVAIPWLFFRFVRDNGIGADDFRWFFNIVGYFKGHEHPSRRFNAGEKLVFWILLTLLSTILVLTGLVLNFPNFGQGRATMQSANMIHMVAAYLAIALALVHIYLGTIGMKGAYQAMRTGYVDETWAKHHHLRWYEEVKAGKSRQRFAQPGEQPPAAARVDPSRTARA